jgi:hypothetical protein
MEEIEGFTVFTVTRTDQHCSKHGGRQQCVPAGSLAYQDSEGFTWCAQAARVVAQAGDPYLTEPYTVPGYGT